jgi:hypothetical protein
LERQSDQAIHPLDFVAKVTDPKSAELVARTVVFDNDGTLWAELPYRAQQRVGQAMG